MQVQGTCKCDEEECVGQSHSNWIDSANSLCRRCEIDHEKRWGHTATKVERANLHGPTITQGDAVRSDASS